MKRGGREGRKFHPWEAEEEEGRVVPVMERRRRRRRRRAAAYVQGVTWDIAAAKCLAYIVYFYFILRTPIKLARRLYKVFLRRGGRVGEMRTKKIV